MLYNIRKIASNFIIRTLLWMIVIAFVVFGVKDVMQDTNNYDIVTFTDAKHISKSDFLNARANEIAMIQKQNAINLTPKDIKDLGLDELIIRRLINNSILQHIATYYDLDISEKAVIQLIKQSPAFNDNDGRFDIEIFHAMIRHSNKTEAEYLQSLKNDILQNLLVTTFADNFIVPKAMIDNIAEYIAEKRDVRLLKINLTSDIFQNSANIQTPTEDELMKFYEDNRDLFSVPAKRDISYCIISSDVLKKKISITDRDVKKYYDDNMDEFDGNKFDTVKARLTSDLKQQKLEELREQLNKDLEDDVAGGASLKEIADKYDAKVYNITGVSYKDILDSKIKFIDQSFAEDIFTLNTGDVSYPVEATNGSHILVSIDNIYESKLEDFKQIQTKVKKILMEKNLRELNLKQFNEIAAKYNKQDAGNQSILKFIKAIASTDIAIIRSDIESHVTLPQTLLTSVFQIKTGQNTPIFVKENYAYFAHLKSVTVDNDTFHGFIKDNKSMITTNIKQCMMDEMIQYFAKQNKMQTRITDIKYEDDAAQSP